MQLHSCSSSYSNHRVRHLSYCKSPHGQDANAHVLLRLSVATPCRSTHSCACCQMPSERSCDGACCCLCLLAIHVMSATTLCMCSVKPLRSVCLFACVAELRGCGTPELWCRSAGNWCVREAVATPQSGVVFSYPPLCFQHALLHTVSLLCFLVQVPTVHQDTQPPQDPNARTSAGKPCTLQLHAVCSAQDSGTGLQE